VIVLLACAPHPEPVDPPPSPRFSPAVTASLAPVDDAVPLVRTLLVTCDVPCAVTATWADEARTRRATSPIAREHELALVGMRPATSYVASLVISDGEGAEADGGEVAWTTDPLPPDFPDVEVRASDPARSEPGDVLLTLGSPSYPSFTVVLDATGAVVWLRRDPSKVLEARREPDGTLLGIVEPDRIFSSTFAGETLHEWTTAAAGLDGFHHEVRRASQGGILTLTHSPVLVTAYPTSYADPLAAADADVLVDRVVRLGDDGEVLADLDLGAILDLRRVGYLSLQVAEGGRDWGHANAVSEHASDGGLVVSLRHQDAVIEIDRDTGELRWILANPDNWAPGLDALRLRPVGEPFAWPYHQHAPVIDGDRVLMFDNGNSRTSPWTGVPEPPITELYSRIVEYRIDEDARTVEQLWEFQHPDERLWSGACGGAEREPVTGNVLSLWGYVTHVDGVATPDLLQSVRLIELVPDTGELITEIVFAEADASWHGYRAHRIPPL
jgi:arylsulfate sulfotransferase